MKNKTGHIGKYALFLLSIIAVTYLIYSANGKSGVILKQAYANYNENALLKSKTSEIQQDEMPYIIATKDVIHTLDRKNNSNAIIEISINGTEYPARLDTGFFGSDVLIDSYLTNKLNLQTTPAPIAYSNLTGGICRLPILRIGNIQLVNPKTLYIDQHLYNSFNGILFERQHYISLGLDFMSKFKFIGFNNIDGTVSFGLKSYDLSGMANSKTWSMSIENDNWGNTRLFITIPIEGKKHKIMFDTCGGNGLIASTNLWRQISANLDIVNSQIFKMQSLQFGEVDCQLYNIKSIQIAGIQCEKASVYVRPPNSKILQDILSLDIFSNANIVLDFERMLFYIQ